MGSQNPKLDTLRIINQYVLNLPPRTLRVALIKLWPETWFQTFIDIRLGTRTRMESAGTHNPI